MDRYLPVMHGHGDDVETHAVASQTRPRLLQPLQRGTAQIRLLGRGDRLLRRAEPAAAPRFHLDEHDLAVRAERDDVEFAVPAMPVAVQDAPAAAFQPCGRIGFAECTHLPAGHLPAAEAGGDGLHRLAGLFAGMLVGTPADESGLLNSACIDHGSTVPWPGADAPAVRAMWTGPPSPGVSWITCG